MHPLISVILPVYNGVRAGKGFLVEAIDSVVRQTYDGPIELIVVNDGSTDSTAHAVQTIADYVNANWKSRRIVPITREHEGVTKALNAGLRVAAGEFLARQDADDYSLPGRFAAQVAFLQREPEYGLIGSAVRTIYERTAKETWYRRSTVFVRRDEFQKGSPFCHGAVMFRREVLTKVGYYDERFPHAQDYDFFWRVSGAYKTGSLPESLYAYRVHPNRVTNRKFGLQRTCAIQIKNRIAGELADEQAEKSSPVHGS